MKFNFFMSAAEKEEIVCFKNGTSEDAIKGAFLDKPRIRRLKTGFETKNYIDSQEEI